MIDLKYIEGIIYFEYDQAASNFLPTLPPTGLELVNAHNCAV